MCCCRRPRPCRAQAQPLDPISPRVSRTRSGILGRLPPEPRLLHVRSFATIKKQLSGRGWREPGCNDSIYWVKIYGSKCTGKINSEGKKNISEGIRSSYRHLQLNWTQLGGCFSVLFESKMKVTAAASRDPSSAIPRRRRSAPRVIPVAQGAGGKGLFRCPMQGRRSPRPQRAPQARGEGHRGSEGRGRCCHERGSPFPSRSLGAGSSFGTGSRKPRAPSGAIPPSPERRGRTEPAASLARVSPGFA